MMEGHSWPVGAHVWAPDAVLDELEAGRTSQIWHSGHLAQSDDVAWAASLVKREGSCALAERGIGILMTLFQMSSSERGCVSKCQ